MAKKMTSVRIQEEVLDKAKEYGVNVSAFLEIRLREYIAMIEGTAGGCCEDSEKDDSPVTLNKSRALYRRRARGPAWTGRQPPKL